MEEVKKLIKIFNNAFNMLNRDIIQTTITKEQVLAIENLINKNKELEKMVELIILDLHELYKQYPGTIDKFYNHKMCLWEDCDDINREVNCDYCLKQYYKKKASEENETKNKR